MTEIDHSEAFVRAFEKERLRKLKESHEESPPSPHAPKSPKSPAGVSPTPDVASSAAQLVSTGSPRSIDRVATAPRGPPCAAPPPVTHPPIRPSQHIDAGRVVGDQLGHLVEDTVQNDVDVPRLGRQPIRVDHDPRGAEDVVGHRCPDGQRFVDGTEGRVRHGDYLIAAGDTRRARGGRCSGRGAGATLSGCRLPDLLW